MSKETTVYRRGFGAHRPVAANIAVQAIAKIEEKYGRVTPQAVVDEARSPKSPLHSLFNWDDKSAAAAYRLVQARVLIKSIVIEKDIAGQKEPIHLTVFHSASDKEGKAYFSLNRIASDVDLFASASESLVGQIESLEKSVTSLNMIAPKEKKPTIKKLGGALSKVKEISEELE